MPNDAQHAGDILKIYIIAGEASGDLLGAHLMRSLKQQSTRPIKFYGIGGERMTAEGLNSLFPYYELSMLGFLEVLPYAFNIAARINRAVEDIHAKGPEIVITIDSPGFCYRVVKKLRKENYPAKFVHYVAPTVWVYRPRRAEKYAKLFDHLLVLLPFEPPYFEKYGLPCTFVGHPVVAETKIGNAQSFREKYQIASGTKLFCLLPGSRKGEVDRHMPIMAQAITMLATRYPDLAIAVAVPKHVLAFIAPYFKGCPFRAIIIANDQEKKDAIAASNVAIVKSGTVALEVALAGTPMVVAYRVNPLSARALKRVILTKYVNLLNVLLGREAIPELLQDHCTPLMLASSCSELLESPERAENQRTLCKTALQQLMPPQNTPPSNRAAEVVLSLLKKS